MEMKKEMNKTFKNTACFAFIGFLFGIIFFVFGNKNFLVSSYENISFNVSTNSLQLFFYSYLSYNKYIIIIFLMTWVNFGFLISYILLFAKGVFLGFTTSFFIYCGKFSGVLEILKLYFLQNVIFIFLLIIVVTASFRYNPKFKNKKYFNSRDLIPVYIFVEIIIVLISLYESCFLSKFL